jgi:hypothetical protein
MVQKTSFVFVVVLLVCAIALPSPQNLDAGSALPGFPSAIFAPNLNSYPNPPQTPPNFFPNSIPNPNPNLIPQNVNNQPAPQPGLISPPIFSTLLNSVDDPCTVHLHTGTKKTIVRYYDSQTAG